MSTSTFPLSGGNQVGSTYKLSGHSTEMEPSGLVVLGHTLYLASDDGYLASMDVSTGANLNKAWTMVHNFTNDTGYTGTPDSYDLESLTVALGQVMIGVEGRAAKSGVAGYTPHIIRCDTNGSPTGSTWNLTAVALGDAGGMEAMTFVPSSACPDYPGTPYYGGYFFAAYQSKPGNVYVYDLPEGLRTAQTVSTTAASYSLKGGDDKTLNLMAADMCFADGYLFILFSGANSSAKDEIHVYSIRTDGGGLDHKAAYYVPALTSGNIQSGYEGLAIDGSNLYLSVDVKNGTKLVWQFTNYAISSFVQA